MEFYTHNLPDTLGNYVESIFYYKGFKPDHSVERVVPTGHIFIIIELDGRPRNLFDNDSLAPIASFQQAWVSGMHSHYLSISALQDSEMLVIQFKPGGAGPFIHKPIDALTNRVISAENLFGDGPGLLRQEILAQVNVKEKFKSVERWLLSRLDTNRLANDELLKVLGSFQSNPFDQHSKIVGSYSKTQKHLINQFKKHIGLTPKILHRIFRFNEILQRIHQKEHIDWLEIVHQFGYTDQSHFIKEFNEFSGFNPQEFILSEHNKEQPNFFPLDRKG